MTLSELITRANDLGYMFDEVYFSKVGNYSFITSFDGYSGERVVFGSKLEAELFFTDPERFEK